MARRRRQRSLKAVETLTHQGENRRNIPTAEYQPVMRDEELNPLQVAYERRNRDLDPQLVWRGKDAQDWSDLIVQAPPLYIQEKVHPKVLIDDLIRHGGKGSEWSSEQIDLFADFNGLPEGTAGTEFYQHDANWSNRMILGDSLQVMASLAEREGLRGQVQCIYIDPPYGIKFNSNFQWSTTSRDVRDGKAEHITREPEQVKAFRDTWRDGMHSYLTYLRDRLTAARDLLTDSGSVFVQIGDENVHLVRSVLDEVFGKGNSIAQIFFKTTGPISAAHSSVAAEIIFFGTPSRSRYPNIGRCSRKAAWNKMQATGLPESRRRITPEGRCSHLNVHESDLRWRRFACTVTTISSRKAVAKQPVSITNYEGNRFKRGRGFWKTNLTGMNRLARAWRLGYPTPNSLSYVRFIDDFAVSPMTDLWTDTQTGAFTDEKTYVVQTNSKVIERCILMATDPGDLVLDPTCGSGTTAYVAEQWGRRWITIDTSRVALALARARIMGARYPYYLLADSLEGQRKEAEIARTAPNSAPTYGRVRQGFVYERVPHITLKSIANNAEVDVIWEKHQETLEPLRFELNTALGRCWEEWQIPREAGDPWPESATAAWNKLQAARTTDEQAAALLVLNRKLSRATRAMTFLISPVTRGIPKSPICTAAGGTHALPARRRSMHPSRPRPSSNTSTTSPMRTGRSSVPRTLHGRKPLPAPDAGSGRERRPDRQGGGHQGLLRTRSRFRADDHRKPQEHRRPASPQGGQADIHHSRSLARPIHMRRGALRRRRRRGR